MGVSTGSWLGQAVRVFDLEQPRFQGMPIHEAHQPGYLYALYRRHRDTYRPDVAGPRSGASGLIVAMEHSGTHIDAVCHQAEHLMLCGGVPAEEAATPRGFTRHGIEEVAPIVAPGVLLDVPRFRGVDEVPAREAISAAELQACAAHQGVSIEPGMVVLVRTGNARHWDAPERYLAGPGMAGDASRWLAEHAVRAVGADNMAWDVIGLRDPEAGCELPGHLELLARRGILIIENLALEELAAAGAWQFTFVCTPLKFNGATGSPVRPVAIVPSGA